MKEMGVKLSVAEISAGVVGGLILIAVLILLLGTSLMGEEKDNREELVKKLKEKEKKLQEKEDKLNQIQKQLMSMR